MQSRHAHIFVCPTNLSSREVYIPPNDDMSTSRDAQNSGSAEWKQGKKEGLYAHVHRRLGSEDFHNPSRALTFEKIIALLVSRRQVAFALEIYDRMLAESLLPNIFTRVKMESLAITHSTKSTQEVYRELKEAFAGGAHDESLAELIKTLDEAIKARYPPEMVDRIIKLFFESKGATYRPSAMLVSQLVELSVRNESSQQPAQPAAWLDLFKQLDTPEASDASPHATFLQALADTDPTDLQAQRAILLDMKNAGIAPTTSVYNALIAAQVNQNNFESVFALYATMQQYRPTASNPSPSLTILPDATTFRFLFRAIKLMRRTRGFRSRAFKKSENAVHARELYADLVESHTIYTKGRVGQPSPAIDLDVLHIILRTFIFHADYAAVLVILRSFEVFNIKPSLKTYQIVIKSLLRAMHHELASARGSTERRWVDVLLCLPEGAPITPGMTGDQVVQLVQYGLDGRITLDPLPDLDDSAEADEWIAKMPSLGLIMGQPSEGEVVPEGSRYALVPLQRIMRRALLAQATFHFKDEFQTMTPAQVLSKVVAKTKESLMRPPPAWLPKTKPPKPDLRKFRSNMYA
ncbi:hypothetical protein HWV62_5399 [Athelia sp. TMB]|nr:hypothetical protein HWV62_5399 [Athelia sp. TMB]